MYDSGRRGRAVHHRPVQGAKFALAVTLSDSDLIQLDQWLAQIESNGLAMQARDQDKPSV